MVGLEIVDLLVEGEQPELLAHEHYCVQLALEARRVPRCPLHQALSHTMAQALQLLQQLALREREGGRAVRLWLSVDQLVATWLACRPSSPSPSLGACRRLSPYAGTQKGSGWRPPVWWSPTFPSLARSLLESERDRGQLRVLNPQT